jgi:hypothetical protein
MMAGLMKEWRYIMYENLVIYECSRVLEEVQLEKEYKLVNCMRLLMNKSYNK